MYTAYYYDNERHQSPWDANELSVNGKFLSHITEVRSSNNLADLQPRSETEELVLIIKSNCKRLVIENFNPCPEERF